MAAYFDNSLNGYHLRGAYNAGIGGQRIAHQNKGCDEKGDACQKVNPADTCLREWHSWNRHRVKSGFRLKSLLS
jgi:hypothetical protein